MLKKVEEGFYIANVDGHKYELKKGLRHSSKGLHRCYRLFKDGEYIGQPQNIKAANCWIKYHNEK